MSENELKKIQKIVLNQLGKDTRLNKAFKLVSKRSLKYQLKENFMLRKFECRQFGPILWKVVWFVGLRVVVKINSH